MKLIVGLGNPGKAYAGNRHNIGFRCINSLARLHAISTKQRQCQAQVGTGQIAGTLVVLAKPRTYMNLSGKSLKSLMQRFRAGPDDIVVIHDDLDLPLGKIRLYQGGGSGGHKGLESIISCLESRDFLRIRVGIGRPSEGDDPVDYVLGNFTPAEEKVIAETVTRVSQAIACLLEEGVQAAMNSFNQRGPAPESSGG